MSAAPERGRTALRDLVNDAPSILAQFSGAARLLRMMAACLRERKRLSMAGRDSSDWPPAVEPDELDLIANQLLTEEDGLSEQIWDITQEEGLACPEELRRDHTLDETEVPIQRKRAAMPDGQGPAP